MLYSFVAHTRGKDEKGERVVDWLRVETNPKTKTVVKLGCYPLDDMTYQYVVRLTTGVLVTSDYLLPDISSATVVFECIRKAMRG